MQYKHTFLFTLILGLVWAGILFGYQNGPAAIGAPGSNGIFGQTCNQAGCHVGFPLNLAGGTLTLAGLPEQWTPGQIYPLTVTIQRTGALKYGFQLSAVFDASNLQAGSFAQINNRVSVITAAGVQYAEHNAISTNIAPFTGIFNVNWTAPPSAAGGPVRFNLAGNAANGNISNTGDFIYARVDLVAPAAVGPPPPDPNLFSFSIENLKGVSRITDGSGFDQLGGYARIQADAGSTTPTGVSIFGLSQNNVLVSEAGVPASPLMTSTRIFIERDGGVNTGVAIANPNDQPATIQVVFTDEAGTDRALNNITIPGTRHIARFIDSPDFGLNPAPGTAVRGTLTLNSDVPVSLIALRTLVNEAPRGEFLMTTLPVVNLSAPPNTGTSYIPHFADGAGWTTRIILINPTGDALNGVIQFVDGNGTPVMLTANGTFSSSFNYGIAARSSFKLVTSPPAGATTTASGSVRITPNGSTAAPTPLVVFSYKPGLVTVSEAGVQGVSGNAHRMYVESTGSGNAPGTIQTGFAVTNASAAAATLTLELFTLNGEPSGLTTVNLPGNGQIARYVHDLFPGLPPSFKGILRISGGGSVSVVSLRLRYNERPGELLVTTTPPSNEGSVTTPNEEFLFPHIVNGGGYKTQFILFSGVAGQAWTGNLRFFQTDGTPFNLTLVP